MNRLNCKVMIQFVCITLGPTMEGSFGFVVTCQKTKSSSIHRGKNQDTVMLVACNNPAESLPILYLLESYGLRGI